MALVTLVGWTMSRLPMTFSGSCPVRLKVSRTSTSYRAKVSSCGLSTSSKRASRICCTRNTEVAARIDAAGPKRRSHVSPARSIGSNGSPSARTMPGTLPGSTPRRDSPQCCLTRTEDHTDPHLDDACGRAERAGRSTSHPAPVSRSPSRPQALRGKVFRGSQVVRAGQLTPAQLRTTAWRRVFPDVWACSSLRLTHELRTLAATRLLVPGAVASGRSAAVLWGAPLAAIEDDVDISLPPGSRGGTIPGVRLRRRVLPTTDVVERRGVQVTDRIRTALDLATIRPFDEAVVAVDAFLVQTRTPIEDVRAAAA